MTDARVFEETRGRVQSTRATILLSFGLVANLAALMTFAATLNEIVSKARQVDELVASVAAASREQSNGIDQVNTAVSQMDKITQQNAALVQQSAASAKAMEEQTGALSEMVAVFKLKGEPRTGPKAASAPRYAASRFTGSYWCHFA